MLSQLCLSNFALFDSLTLDFESGLNVISGDTGAGKSLLFSALNLLLGERGDADWVRTGQEKAELSAHFDLTYLPKARHWLIDSDLMESGMSDQTCDCIIRRVIRKDGRSRAFINGVSCPLSLLKTFGKMILEYHGQHQHTSLLDVGCQLDWYDHITGAKQYRDALAAAYDKWQLLESKKAEVSADIQEVNKRKTYLEFQLTELEQVEDDLKQLDDLEAKLKSFQHAEQSMSLVHQALLLLDGSPEFNCLQCLNQITHLLSTHQPAASQAGSEAGKSFDQHIKDAFEMLTVADIHVQEATKCLEDYSRNTEVDADLYERIESQLSDIYRLSRKHQVTPKELLGLIESFRGELNTADQLDDIQASLDIDISRARGEYLSVAGKVSAIRKKGQAKFEQDIVAGLHQLGLEKVRFKVRFSEVKPEDTGGSSFASFSKRGLESLSFLFSPNAGHVLKPLHKTISGGELSRLSLVLQAHSRHVSPDLGSDMRQIYLFDEVDVGVSGSVAESIGHMLSCIGRDTQVFCITHSAQVAAQGAYHWKAAKSENLEGIMTTAWRSLEHKDRVQELARMLGGLTITQHTKRYAKEMLESAHRTAA